MKLVVKNNLGETVSLQIRPEDTFIDLKDRVETEAGLSLDLNDIATNGKRIIETQKVIDYFMHQESEETLEEEADVQCAVPGCENSKITTPDKVFFDFPQLPKEEIRCHQWVLYCQRLSMASGKHRMNLTQESAICSDHFRADQFVKNTTTLLKRTAVPCINPELVKSDQPLKPVAVQQPVHCRLCGKKTTDFIALYGAEGKKGRLAEKINSCLPIKVQTTDKLPKQICKTCVEEVESLYNYGEVCCNADEDLKKVMFHSQNTDHCPLCEEGDLKTVESEQGIFIKEEPGEVEPEDVESDDSEENGAYICHICNQEYVEFSEFMKHRESHSVDSLFHCPNCENYYDTADDLEQHVVATHRDNEESDVLMQCKTCKVTFKSYILLASHGCESIPLLHSNKCSICHKTFRSKARLQFHMKFHSGARPGFCTLCKKTFPDEVKLYKHTVYLHSSGKSHHCDDCGKIFRSDSALKYHQRTHLHDGFIKPFTCEFCNKGFVTKAILQTHVSMHHKNASQEASCFTCKICTEAFPSTYVAVAHMDAKHKEECQDEPSYSFEMHTLNRVFICEFCERTFAEGQTLNRHRLIHNSETPYECKYCLESFVSFGEHSDHKSSHVDRDIPLEYSTTFVIPLTYICEYCDRTFLNYIKFSEHLTVHYHPEPYQCRVCPARFKTLDEAQEHRLSHPEYSSIDEINQYRPYECHYCTKCFTLEDALIKHIRMHTGEKPFICDQCGKGFSQSSGLYTHQKVHSNARPYECHICERSFKIKGDRDVHVRKHSGDRPYKCEYCGKAFMTQHVYSQHRKIHTGERPYKCDVCGIAFRRSHVLTVHKRIHTGEKPNICDICGKRYRQKGDMLKHKRIQHSIIR